MSNHEIQIGDKVRQDYDGNQNLTVQSFTVLGKSERVDLNCSLKRAIEVANEHKGYGAIRSYIDIT